MTRIFSLQNEKCANPVPGRIRYTSTKIDGFHIFCTQIY